MMKHLKVLPLLLGLFFAFNMDVVNAQAAASATREDVKKERDEFMKTHQYDASIESWVLKPGFEPPAGMKGRAEIKAERDEFIKTHKYDAAAETWVPLKAAKGTMTREQVRAESAAFTRTHKWDDASSTWVETKTVSKKK
jgi:hypothetical protein